MKLIKDRKFTLGPLSITFDRVWWRLMWHQGFVGVFKNRKDVIPGRWGFYLGGIEFGSRESGNRFGTWLKEHGLWPW